MDRSPKKKKRKKSKRIPQHVPLSTSESEFSSDFPVISDKDYSQRRKKTGRVHHKERPTSSASVVKVEVESSLSSSCKEGESDSSLVAADYDREQGNVDSGVILPPQTTHCLTLGDCDDSSVSSVDSDLVNMVANLKKKPGAHRTRKRDMCPTLGRETKNKVKNHKNKSRPGNDVVHIPIHKTEKPRSDRTQRSMLHDSRSPVNKGKKRKKRKSIRSNGTVGPATGVTMEMVESEQHSCHLQAGTRNSTDQQELSCIQNGNFDTIQFQNGNQSLVSHSKRNKFLANDANTEEPDDCYHDNDDDDVPDKYERLHQVWVSGPKNLEEEVGPRRKGKWSNEEMKLLHTNVTRYMKKYHIDNIHEFISEKKYKQTNFFECAAKGINRTVFSVYQKVRLFYNDENYGGVYTKEEDKELLKLQSQFGNKWTLIGLKLGRTGESVLHRFSYIKGCKARGKWSAEEEERLKVAVLAAFHSAVKTSPTRGGEQECEDESESPAVCDAPLPSTKTWDMVGQEVGTRSGEQCRQKWFYHLCWKVGKNHGKWTVQDNLRLVEKVSSLDVDCEPLIDWQALSDGWLQARSAYYLRRKWNSLIRFIPNYVVMDFPELMDYLNEFKVPEWKKMVEQDLVDNASSEDDE